MRDLAARSRALRAWKVLRDRLRNGQGRELVLSLLAQVWQTPSQRVEIALITRSLDAGNAPTPLSHVEHVQDPDHPRDGSYAAAHLWARGRPRPGESQSFHYARNAPFRAYVVD